LDRQREIYRIQVIEIATPKKEASDGNRAGQKQRLQPISGNHAHDRCILEAIPVHAENV
jgi:hypothetical protein